MSIHTATMHTEQRTACTHTQSPSMHRNAHTCVSYPFTCVCMPLTHIYVTVTQCTHRLMLSVHSVAGPQAAAPRPHLIRTERHMGHACSHVHMYTCAVMPGGVTSVCPAFHMGRSMHTSASNIYSYPGPIHHHAWPQVLTPGMPFPPPAHHDSPAFLSLLMVPGNQEGQ